MLKIYELCRAFQVYPAQLYQLEARGILPPRPGRGQVTPEYLRALGDYKRTHGGIPEAAAAILAEVIP